MISSAPISTVAPGKPTRARFGAAVFCVALDVNAYRSNNRSSVNSQTR
jgi:hypothetical protein